jgi:hypothetical protein
MKKIKIIKKFVTGTKKGMQFEIELKYPASSVKTRKNEWVNLIGKKRKDFCGEYYKITDVF